MTPGTCARCVRRGMLVLAAGVMLGCVKAEVDVKPIEIKPITINVNLRIQREVDNSMLYLYGDASPAPGETPRPDTQPKPSVN